MFNLAIQNWVGAARQAGVGGVWLCKCRYRVIADEREQSAGDVIYQDYRKEAAETLPTITAVSPLLISASIFSFLCV